MGIVNFVILISITCGIIYLSLLVIMYGSLYQRELKKQQILNQDVSDADLISAIKSKGQN